MPNQFQIINSDPRKWDDWEKLTTDSELRLVRECFVEGGYNDYLNKQDCAPEEMKSRLQALAYIWGE